MATFSQSHFLKNLVSHKAQKEKISYLGFLIVFIATLYYCFAYLLRVYPNIMAADLLQRFHTTSVGYSLLTVFYYVAYAPMQIPIGVSVDKIGPRRSLLAACLIALIGIGIFASANLLTVALIGRFLVGLGAAFAYITALKLAASWLPRQLFATATGFVTAFGMIAASLTEIGFTYLLEKKGYQLALYMPLYIGLGLFFLILLFIKDNPEKSQDTEEEASAISFSQLWRYLMLIISNRQMWLIGIVGCLLYLPSSVFLDAWAIPYLKSAHQFNALQAADAISLMLVGWVASSIAAGLLSDFLRTRKKFLVISAILSTITSSLLFFIPNLSHLAIYILLFLFGLACGPHPLCFTLSKENWSRKIAGTAVSFANFVIMMGGFIAQPLIGSLLNLNWHGTYTESGIRLYTNNTYMHALASIPLSLLIASMLAFLIEDTYKKPKNEALELDRSIQRLVDEQTKP
jgi:MFS family permease